MLNQIYCQHNNFVIRRKNEMSVKRVKNSVKNGILKQIFVYNNLRKSFLVIADRLSGWPVLVPCKGDTTALNTIRFFCRYFREVGVPLRLQTDGGPQFTSKEFRNFVKRSGVFHVVTSPHPQSNGHAEAAVRSLEHLILKTAPLGNTDCEDFDRGLLGLRNTPSTTGRSPAQILYGHPLRPCVPAHPQSFSTDWQAKTEDCDRRAAARAETEIKSP
ncbi:uncharacterized protein [Penaeus vannamei]|uniref:uncharacterized protein n=1 Tax=Penaeus vannamei TaxID=6689 RepID=UPI00387F6D3C